MLFIIRDTISYITVCIDADASIVYEMVFLHCGNEVLKKPLTLVNRCNNMATFSIEIDNCELEALQYSAQIVANGQIVLPTTNSRPLIIQISNNQNCPC